MANLSLRPATMVDFVKLYPRATKRLFKIMNYQITHFPAFAIDLDGVPVLIAGAAPIYRDALECWVLIPAALRRSPWRRMALAMLIKRTRVMFPTFTLWARVREANKRGQRLTALADFFPFEIIEGDPSSRWWVRDPVNKPLTPERITSDETFQREKI